MGLELFDLSVVGVTFKKCSHFCFSSVTDPRSKELATLLNPKRLGRSVLFTVASGLSLHRRFKIWFGC